MFLIQTRWRIKTMKQFLLLIIFVLGTISVTGCADHSTRTEELLVKNYQDLSNDDLILYYYELNDQIDLVERRKSKPSLSLGLGMGSFGTRSGASGGVGVSTGRSSTEFATELRDRRNQVKLELKKRDISP